MIKKFCVLIFLLLVTSSFGNDDCDEDYAIFGCGLVAAPTIKPVTVTRRPAATTPRPTTTRKITTPPTYLNEEEEKEAEYGGIDSDANTVNNFPFFENSLLKLTF